MKKTGFTMILCAALALSMVGCGAAPTAGSGTSDAPAQVTLETPAPAENEGQTEPSVTTAPVLDTGRQDGERFESVITMEGMEETVRYEHIVNRDAGFEMDYDYESFVRQSDGARERFISVWDDPENPENYLDVSFDTASAELMADAVSVTLSNEYDVLRSERELTFAGSCIRLEASVIKGTNQMADQLQAVYLIPAADGCRVATAHYSIEAAEGFGRRFACMIDTLIVLDREAEQFALSDEAALSAIRQYCMDNYPELEGKVDSEDYLVYWELASSDEQQIVVLFRSYTGAEVRYYIDRATGDTYVTEFMPGITPEEERTEETLNVWDWLG